ncbi:MAG: HPr family phosphocarrier protein [Lachnospiraceae bacterium]|nr:HPr family phosphocarrier protein [Lachnospiraceae bacterium]
MYSKTLVISGVPSAFSLAELVHLACTYTSHLTIRCEQDEYNVKSIMGMMSLNLHAGPLLITGHGTDEKEAVEAISLYLTTGTL